MPVYQREDRRVNAENLRAALIREASACLDERPASDVSLRDIARGAGVTHAAAYRHFRDREAVFGAVAAQDFEALTAAILAATAEPSGSPLERAGIAYVTFALSRPHRFRSMFGQLGRGDAAVVEKASLLLAATPSLVTSGTSEAAALTLWVAVHGIACLALDGALPPQARDPVALARAIVSSVLIGG